MRERERETSWQIMTHANQPRCSRHEPPASDASRPICQTCSEIARVHQVVRRLVVQARAVRLWTSFFLRSRGRKRMRAQIAASARKQRTSMSKVRTLVINRCFWDSRSSWCTDRLVFEHSNREAKRAQTRFGRNTGRRRLGLPPPRSVSRISSGDARRR